MTKICGWCGGIIGSKEYKTFINKENPEAKSYFHIFCNKVMKLKGLIRTIISKRKE